MGYDLKKKYVTDIKVDWSYKDLMSKINIPNSKVDYKDFDQAYVFTEDNRIIQGFLYLHNGKPLVIPEPEPSILYFINASRQIDKIISIRTQLFDMIGLEKIIQADQLFSEFFFLGTNFVINLYSSIEAFNNSIIPNDFTIKIKKRFMDKDTIQRYACFEDKMKTIVPRIFNRSFVIDFNNKWELLDQLKSLRDSVIHTKNFSKNWAASYRNIYRDYLSFDFENVFKYAKDYMNYYKPDWIANYK